MGAGIAAGSAAITTSHKVGDQLDYTPAAALSPGDPVVLDGGIIVFTPSGKAGAGVAASELAGFDRKGLRKIPKEATSDTYAIGDDVYWDDSAAEAVAPALNLVGGTDHYVGRCVLAAAATDTDVVVDPRLPPRHHIISPIVYEFDCDGDNGDTDEHILIPASQNRHGLLFLGAYALVTEVMAGSSEDQGVVTIEDEDDNALCTLTASDAAADVVDDVIVGTNDLFSASTGDAAKVVAAGKAVQGFVSQQTSGGTPAGKMKVYVMCIPLL